MSELASKNVDDWIQHLNDEDMPGFAGTVTDVTQAVNSYDTSAADVAQSILKDPALTSRLLKMANSLFYNPSGQAISTVSRAVMVMGFDQVRALALSLVLIDSLSDGQQRDILTEEIAYSFHAAIQAQELAIKTKNKSPENIFVATLLSRLGNMAFWAFSGEKATELLNLMNSTQMTAQEAEATLLGFSLNDLTKGLSKAWSLGNLLDKSLSNKPYDDPQLDLINMGQKLAQAAKMGWDTKEAKEAIKDIAKKLDLKVDNVIEIAHSNAKKAKAVTKLYGITAASKRIPQPKIALVEEDSNQQQQIEPMQEIDEEQMIETELDEQSLLHPEPDSTLQLTILSDITRAISEKPNINIILEMVLEGLYRGVGMDRSLFAILSKDFKTLTCKYALGADNQRLCDEFKIDISHSRNIFHQVIQSKQPMHVLADPKLLNGTLSRDVFRLLGTPPYLIMPTIVRGKVIGVFMADRNASKRKIEQKDFVAFQQFCQQANMGLTFLSMQG